MRFITLINDLSRETKEKILNTLTSIIIAISMVLLILGMTVLKPKCPNLPPRQIPRSLVVAQDGSGNVTSISAAIEAAPSRSTKYFGIFIKPGVYREEVRIPDKKTMLAFIGAGMGVSVISSNSSATVVIEGHGFVAIDMSFENTRGDPTTGYTVAVANQAQNTAFQGCSFKGYSGVLKVGCAFQFYGRSQFYGAVDLVWGNGAAVFQKCALYVENPQLPGQRPGALTLQQRADPNLQGGFVFHGCSVVAAVGSDQPGYSIFLGRQGSPFSTVVFMECYLGGVITTPSAPWLTESPPPKTLYLAEYNNGGPGADPNNTITPTEAAQFTIRSFIKDDDWLWKTTVEYVSAGFL